MFIEELVKSEVRQSQLTEGLSHLYQAGYFQAALELAIQRAGSLEGPNLLERTAVQRGFIEGYKEAILDLYHFKERYVAASGEKKPDANYGAISQLQAAGDLTQEEADELQRTKYLAGGRY